MKLLIPDKVEQQKLREMGVFHRHSHVWIQTKMIERLSQGLTLQQTADEFHVHLNSIEQWRQRWNKQGLAGMYEGHQPSRGRKWTDEQQDVMRTLSIAESRSTNILLRSVATVKDLPTINEKILWPYLRDMNFSCNIYYYILKNTSKESFWHGHLGNRRVRPAPVPSNGNFYL
jgi:transposase